MTRVFSDHCGPKGDKGDTGQPGPAGVSVIGMSISGSVGNAILFADASGNLAQDAGFNYTPGGLGNTADLEVTNNSAVADGAVISAVATSGSLGTLILNQTQAYVFDTIAGLSSVLLDLNTASLVGYNLDANADGSVTLKTQGTVVGPQVTAVSIDADTGAVTIPSLAGTGTRNVVVDANGKLSAP